MDGTVTSGASLTTYVSLSMEASGKTKTSCSVHVTTPLGDEVNAVLVEDALARAVVITRVAEHAFLAYAPNADDVESFLRRVRAAANEITEGA